MHRWHSSFLMALLLLLYTGTQATAAETGEVLAFDFDAVRPRYVYTVAAGTGVRRTTDLGRTWTTINRGLPTSPGHGPVVNTVAAHPGQPGTLFAGTGAGIYRSLDRGNRWSLVSSVPTEDFNTISFDPNRSDTVFAGGNILVRSRNGGRTWARLQLPSTSYEPEIAEVVVSPFRSKTVFVLDFNQRRGEARSLFRSTDGGDTWTLVFDGGPSALAHHPALPGVFYLATERGGNIWRSVNGGQNWTQVAAGVGNGAPLTAILVDRLDPATLYLGADGTGIWRSRDQGATWAPLDVNLTNPRVTCLKWKPQNPHRLFACTWGGGLQDFWLN